MRTTYRYFVLKRFEKQGTWANLTDVELGCGIKPRRRLEERVCSAALLSLWMEDTLSFLALLLFY